MVVRAGVSLQDSERTVKIPLGKLDHKLSVKQYKAYRAQMSKEHDQSSKK